MIVDTENMTDVLKRYLGSWSFHLWEQEDFAKNTYQFNPVQYGGIMPPRFSLGGWLVGG